MAMLLTAQFLHMQVPLKHILGTSHSLEYRSSNK